MSVRDLFFANDGADGAQLWVTDGTAAGTRALTSFPSTGPAPNGLTVVDGVAYFLAPDGNGSFGPQDQLWRSDGTAAGTFAIGLASSTPVQIGNTLLYLGADDTHREALFASVNGQAPQFISQLGQSSNASFSAPFLGVAGGELLLEAPNNVWVSDGTSAGTHQLSDGESSPSIQNAAAPVTFNGAGYFVGWDSSNTNQLFRLNGGGVASVVPASTIGNSPSGLVPLPGHLVYMASDGLDSWDGVSSSHVKLFANVSLAGSAEWDVGGKLYFEGPDQANPNSPTGLYVTDGTLAGTHQVASGSFDGVVDLGSRLVLDGGANGIFVSDGAVVGTTNVVASSFGFNDVTKVGDRAFFVVNSAQLWVTDGTVAGTHELASGLSINNGISGVGDELVFVASADGSNQEPWVSDGTVAGTHAITNIHPTNPGNLGIADEASFGSAMAFVGTPPTSGAAIWVTNGTAAGTGAILTSFNAPPFIQGPAVAAGGNLFFAAESSAWHLMVVPSGAAPGTTATDLGDVFTPQFMMPFDNKLFFFGNAGGVGDGLYASDGTSAGTAEVASANILAQPVVLGADLIFVGINDSDLMGVFKSDGTSAGTTFSPIAGGSLTNDLTPSSLTVSGAKVFFAEGTGDTGAELWVTDGTAAGTALVKDIDPGVAGSNPSSLTAFDGGVIFNTSNDGGQIWFSNGTSAGTFQLTVNPTHNPAGSLQVSQAVQFGGKTFFVGNDGVHGDQLWSSNGTSVGTSVVAQLGVGAPMISAGGFGVLGSKLLIADGGQLWVSDGSSAGTVELQPPGGFSSIASSFALVNGDVYFVGTISGQAADDLFVTDGTNAGTHDLGVMDQNATFSVGGDNIIFHSGAGLFAYNTDSLTRVSLGGVPQSDAYVVKVGSQIEVGTPANGAPGNNLWVTDGTAAGTLQLTSLASNVALTNFTALGGDVYFSSFGGNSGLWVTNGTAAGTHEIRSNLDVLSDTFVVIGGNLFFHAMDAGVERVFFYTPSTQALTEVPNQTVASAPFDVTPVGTGAYFVANDASSQNELWHTNNTGTVTELTSASNGGGVEGPLAVSGSNLFFAAVDSTHGQGLFVTNGSSVTFLAQVNDMANFTVIGSELYFQAGDITNGDELWVSDGTVAGSHRVTDTETPGAATGAGFTAVGAQMFFAASDGVHGQELWVFNGQAGGASLVTDLDPGSAGSNPADLTAFNGALYFAASNGTGPVELWRSNGTAAGTVAVSTSADGASPQQLTVANGELFYFGSDTAHGSGLFVTNGTAAPTFVRAFTSIADMAVEGGKLYFQGSDASGAELWTSNGAAAGTVKLSTTGADPGASPSNLTSLSADFTPREDFNRDSRSDFLIQNHAGAVVVGEAVHGQAAYASVSGLGPEWSFHGAADFIGDGRQDFLIENTSGVIAVGDVSAGQTAFTLVGGLGSEWKFEGVGDFVGHDRAQFLIENGVGAVVTGEVVGGHAVYTQVAALGPEWKFVGAGDFLGDGRDDFLIQNTGGAVAIGEVIGGATTYTNIVGLGHEWKFVGGGDFLGEGHDQFLIENSAGAVDAGDWSNGQVHFTQLAALGSEWKFVGAGDYLGEGHDQFLIENASGGVVVGDWTGGQIHYTQVGALGSEWAFH